MNKYILGGLKRNSSEENKIIAHTNARSHAVYTLYS